MSTQTPGQVVRKAREGRGLSRPTLADRAGVSISTVARLELNDRLPSARALARIARVVGVDLDALLDMSEAEEPARAGAA